MKETITITFEEKELEVTGYYIPEEEPVMYYSDMSGHPGSPSDFEIYSIKIGDIDVTDDYDDYMEDVIDVVISEIEKR